MQFEAESIQNAAERFLVSRHPLVLLGVPGCGPCAISPAHWRSRSLRFQGARQILVQNVDEFSGVVTWIATGQESDTRLSPSLRKALKEIVCYCAKTDSILALRQKDCVHEAHYQQFRDYRGALRSLPGWEFNLIQNRSASPPRRVYQVLRTHSRLLAEGPSPVLRSVTGLLEVRLVGSKYLRLIVDGLPGEGSLKGRVELQGVAGTSPTLLSEFVRAIPRADLPTYQILDEQLAEAYRRPAFAEEILRQAVDRLSGGADPNYPVIDIITALMDPPRRGQDLQRVLLRKRINLIRSRLWDAPVIANRARNLLDCRLDQPEFDAQSRELPLDVRADLVALTMPLAKLEAGDFYLRHAA